MIKNILLLLGEKTKMLIWLFINLIALSIYLSVFFLVIYFLFKMIFNF